VKGIYLLLCLVSRCLQLAQVLLFGRQLMGLFYPCLFELQVFGFGGTFFLIQAFDNICTLCHDALGLFSVSLFQFLVTSNSMSAA
jgi:hypothetical protein